MHGPIHFVRKNFGGSWTISFHECGSIVALKNERYFESNILEIEWSNDVIHIPQLNSHKWSSHICAHDREQLASDLTSWPITSCSNVIRRFYSALLSCTIEPLHRWSNPNRLLLPPPDVDSPQNILNSLNDDCLRVILENCDISSLVEIAFTCTRFPEMAKVVYRHKFRKTKHIIELQTWSLQKIEQYLQIFGDECEYFDLTLFDTPDAILGMIIKHCTNLKGLLYYTKELPVAYEIKKIFSKLQRLHASQVDRFNLTKVFKEEPLLEMLHLEECGVLLPQQNFPNLVDVKMASCSILNGNSYEWFFLRNPQILRLEMFNIYDAECLAVIKFMCNLEELTMISFGVDFYTNSSEEFVQHFVALTKLKKLSFMHDEKTILPFLSILKAIDAPLESLTIQKNLEGPAAVDKICQFKTLKVLQFVEFTPRWCFEDITVIELLNLIQELPQLEKIYVLSTELTLTDILSALENKHHLCAVNFTVWAARLLLENNQNAVIERISRIAINRNVRIKLEIIYENEMVSVKLK